MLGVRTVPRPVGADEFAVAMTRLAPFEPKPIIAAAVSGGPDSMALVLLLQKWARRKRGSVLALTVDHGLRPESAKEARDVAKWMKARGIAHAVLKWKGEKPASGVQRVARDARYALLIDACAARGILHLAVAHHAGDQAETILFRRERDSGAEGLAGMPAQRSLGAVRLIRPLLDFPKSRLVAAVEAERQPFVEDPSNVSPRYARTDLRRRLAREPGLGRELLNDARGAARRRAVHERDIAKLLGVAVEARPDGSALLDRGAWLKKKPALRRGALAAILRTIGGALYAPEPKSIVRLETALRKKSFSGGSLGGCLVRPSSGGILICREAGRIGRPVALKPSEPIRWDGRFLVGANAAPRRVKLRVGALGARGYAQIRRQNECAIPSVVAAALPAVTVGGRMAGVPHLRWKIEELQGSMQRFAPFWPLSTAMFTVVCASAGIICDKVELVSAAVRGAGPRPGTLSST